MPFEYYDGSVAEWATDAALPMQSGISWSHTRSYSSKLNLLTSMDRYPGTSSQGINWQINEAPRLFRRQQRPPVPPVYYPPPPAPQPTYTSAVYPLDEIAYSQNAMRAVIFTRRGDAWVPRDGVRMKLETKVLTEDEAEAAGEDIVDPYLQDWSRHVVTDLETGVQRRFYVWDRVNDPWKGGLIERVIDARGYEIGYIWQYTSGRPLLQKVIDSADRQVTFSYNSRGLLIQINVYDGDETSGNVIMQAQYDYFDGSPGNTDLGSTDDLIKVVTKSADSAGNLTMQQTTLYRYYNDGDVDGGAHQLKAVFPPQSVAEMLAGNPSLQNDPDNILALSDNDPVVGSKSVLDLASRVFTYYVEPVSVPTDVADEVASQSRAELDETGFVRKEIVRGGCSSCSEGTGTWEAHYMASTVANPTPNDASRIVVIDRPDGVREVYGINSQSGKVAVKIKEGTAAWYEKVEYCADTESVNYGQMTKFFPPSTFDASGNLVTGTGAVDVYVYDSNGNPVAEKVQKGGQNDPNDTNATAWLRRAHPTSTCPQYWLRRYEYSATPHTYNGVPIYLLEKTYAYSQESADLPTTDVPVVQYDYKSWYMDGTTETHRPKEIWIIYTNPGANQNGPASTGTTTTTVRQWYDAYGRLRWMKDGEGYVHYFGYNSANQMTIDVWDVDTASLSDEITGDGSVSSWGLANTEPPFTRTASRTAIDSIEQVTYDTLGRLIRQVGGGQEVQCVYLAGETRTYNGIYANTAGDNLLVRVPFQVERFDAQDRPTEVLLVKETVDPADALPTGSSWRRMAGTESIVGEGKIVGRTTFSYLPAGGRLQWQRQYHTITYGAGGALTDGAAVDTYYETRYTYDEMGRPTLTKRQVSKADSDHPAYVQYQVGEVAFDVMNRIEAVKEGIEVRDGDDEVIHAYAGRAVRELIYDEASAVKGHDAPTTVKGWPGGTQRQIGLEYDWRGRPIIVEPPVNAEDPATPFSVYGYDNLDRVTAKGTYSTAPASNAALLDVGAQTGRVTLSTFHYDVMARPYQVRQYMVDTDGSISATGFVHSDFYYDNRDLRIASVTPGRGAQVVLYDGTGLPIWLFKAGGLPATKYTQVASAPEQWRFDYPDDDGFKVVEAVNLELDATGNVTKKTLYELNHDASTSGSQYGFDFTNKSNLIRRYVGFWYDEAGRLAATADYGTNHKDASDQPDNVWADAEGPTIVAGSPPQSSDSVLVTTYTYGYDTATSDPTVKVTKPKDADTDVDSILTRDFLGRTIKVVEDDGATRLNRTTTYQYNGSNNISALTAALPGQTPDHQTTGYVYYAPGTDPNNDFTLLRVREVRYPDASTGNPSSLAAGKVVSTYNRDGSVSSRLDQNGTTLGFVYDELGRAKEIAVTAGAGVDDSVTAVKYTYDPIGRPEGVDGYNGTTLVHSVAFGYNSLGQISSETLDPDGANSAMAAAKVEYTYSLDATQNHSRLTTLSYPARVTAPSTWHPRQVTWNYATNAYYPVQGYVGNAFSRVNRISDSTGVLAEYASSGLSRLINRWTSEAGSSKITLSMATRTSWDSPADYGGYDRFGRVREMIYASYLDDPSYINDDIVYAGHVYGRDRAGNPTYDIPHTLPEHARIHTYDNLNRLTASQTGLIKATHDEFEEAPYGQPRTIDPTYDLLGNFTQSQVNQYSETRSHNGTNEITGRTAGTPANESNRYVAEGFVRPDPLDSPLDDWTALAGAFSISSEKLLVGTPGTDTGLPWGGAPNTKAMLLLNKLSHMVGARYTASITFPEGTGDMYAGIVFSYQNSSNYWVYLVRRNGVNYDTRVYRVSNGSWDLLGQSGSATDLPLLFSVVVQGNSATDGNATASTDAPIQPGMVGLFATHGGTVFDDFHVTRIDWRTPASPTWQVYAGQFTQNSGTVTLAPSEGDPTSLAVRLGTHAADYDIEAELTGYLSGVAFRVKDKGSYYCLQHAVVNQSGQDFYVVKLSQAIDGQFAWTGVMNFITTVQSNSTSRHIRLKVDGGNLGVWAVENGSWQMLIDPTQDGAGVLTTTASGLVGLVSDKTQAASCTLLRVGSDGDSYLALDPASEAWVNETFDTSVSTTYDYAGNMTSDGIYKYTYDAWNRLVKVTRLGPTGTGLTPQVVATYHYDGLGRRIYKKVENSGAEEYFYYARWRLLEVGNADDKATKQFVWGGKYIDEAICMDVDTDTEGDGYGDCTDAGSRRYLYMQDRNYNVIGLWDVQAEHMLERYEYDAYGTCRIYKAWDSSAGHESLSVVGSSLAAGGGNPIRFCGYYHDDETGLYHVRYRMYSPGLGRWLQWDPVGYIDGMSLYGYAGNNPVDWIDPLGLTIYVSPSPFPGQECQMGPYTMEVPDGRNWIRDIEELTDNKLYEVAFDTFNSLRKRYFWERMDEGRFDTFFYTGKRPERQYWYIYKGTVYDSNEINYLGIGMYEAWLGNSWAEAGEKTYHWKSIRYGHDPSDNVYHWLFWGYTVYTDLDNPYEPPEPPQD